LRNVQGSAHHKSVQALYYLEREVTVPIKCTYRSPSVWRRSARLAPRSVVMAKRAVEMA